MIVRNKLIFNKYKIKSLIGLSSFCSAYQGENVKTNEPIFIKLQKRNVQFNNLESELYCLLTLKGFGIPRLISYGKIGLYNVLIEELLGESLYKLWKLWKLNKVNKKLNLKNVCMVALQVLNRLEYIHSKNYVHKDVKPQNFVIGRKDPHIIYIIDFGTTQKYRSSRTGKHIKFIDKKIAVGSLSFLSVNGTNAYEQSRRDDLESLGYMLLFLATGSLPWMKIEKLKINKRQQLEQIYNLKKTINVDELCKGLPGEFVKFISYSRNLEFEEDPNYDYLRSLFTSILAKNQERNDLNFIWLIKKKNFVKKTTQINSVSLNFTNKGRTSSKNRLYNKIKNSLDKRGSIKKEIDSNNSFINSKTLYSFNFKNLYQNINYSSSINNRKNKNNDDEYTENIQHTISNYNNNIYITNSCFNIEKTIDENKDDKISDRINMASGRNNYNIYTTNNKYLNYKLNLNDKVNICLTKKINYKEHYIYDNKSPNNNLKNKKPNKNIVLLSQINYKTLYERQKEKELMKNINHCVVKKDKFISVVDNSYSINQSNSLNLYNTKFLNSKNMVRNITPQNFIENNSSQRNINKNLFILKNRTDFSK